MRNKEYPYLYLGSISDARRHNELSDWKASHLLNIECKEVIEEAIRKGFDGLNLNPDCAKEVVDAYGFKRVNWVLSNTIQQKKDDGRFSPANKEWANATFVPDSKRNNEFVVGSHPAVLDGFVTQFRAEQAELHLFDHSHCETISGQDLIGKVLVMDTRTLKESYWSQENQLWYAIGGFGCDPNASGRAVFAVCLGDGERVRWNRFDFLGPIKDEFLPEWAKEQVEKLKAGEDIQPITPESGQVMKL